jgi:hypothetical protein
MAQNGDEQAEAMAFLGARKDGEEYKVRVFRISINDFEIANSS